MLSACIRFLSDSSVNLTSSSVAAPSRNVTWSSRSNIQQDSAVPGERVPACAGHLQDQVVNIAVGVLDVVVDQVRGTFRHGDGETCCFVGAVHIQVRYVACLWSAPVGACAPTIGNTEPASLYWYQRYDRLDPSFERVADASISSVSAT